MVVGLGGSCSGVVLKDISMSRLLDQLFKFIQSYLLGTFSKEQSMVSPLNIEIQSIHHITRRGSATQYLFELNTNISYYFYQRVFLVCLGSQCSNGD